MKDQRPFNIHSRIKSVGFALQGIATFLRTQHNAWIHLAAAIAAITMGFWCQLDRIDWLLIILAIGIVFTAEMFNTAIEFLTDLASPTVHPLAKKAKDVAAASVLIASVVAVAIGALVFVPKFL